MPSTINYYHRRRNDLIATLGGRCALECAGIGECRGPIQIHHNDPADQGESHAIGGWTQLIRCENDYLSGRDIRLLCRAHHAMVHRTKLGTIEALIAEVVGNYKDCCGDD